MYKEGQLVRVTDRSSFHLGCTFKVVKPDVGMRCAVVAFPDGNRIINWANVEAVK